MVRWGRILVAFALCLIAAAAHAMGAPIPPMFPSGAPSPGLRLPAVQTDVYGNAWMTRGRGRPHRLLLTHRDVPGYVVSEVSADGFLRVQRLGAGASPLVDQFMVGQRVVVYTQGGALPAVVACPSTHFRRGADVPVPEATVDDLWVDAGAESDRMASAMGIALLDPVAPLRPGGPGSRPTVGPGAGVMRACGIVATVAKLSAPFPGTGTTTFAWVSGGTEGARGSLRLRNRFADVDSVIVLEPYPSPGADSTWRTSIEDPSVEYAPGDTAHAPSVGWADAWSRAPGSRDRRIHSIPSADARAWAAAGKPTIVVGIPVAYLGTHAEIAPWSFNPSWVQFLTGMRPAHERGAEVLSPNFNIFDPVVEATPWMSAQPGSSPIGPLDGGPPHDAAIKTLAPLLFAYGVSEHESDVAQAVLQELDPAVRPSARIDERGNVILAIGDGPPDRLFVAHMDEIGYRLTTEDPNGRWRAERKGGFYDWLFEGQVARSGMPVVVAPRAGYRTGPRPAIASPLSDTPRTAAGAGSRFDLQDVRVDPWPISGRLHAGADVTVFHEIARLGEHRVSARAIDDRYGCAALVMAAKELWPERKSLPSTVWLVWSVEEEIGLRGATWLADSLLKLGMLPKRVHAVDTFVSSDSPLEDQRYGDAKLGKGAVVRAVDTSHEAPIEAVRATLALAKRLDIPLQYGVTSGGNDGVPFAERGSINVPLAWPLRYAHSAVEVADLRDLESLTRLVVALSREKVYDDPNRP
jgi:putative aminopeptidase FrvX